MTRANVLSGTSTAASRLLRCSRLSEISKRQYQNAIEYIVEAMQPKFASQPATSLLPTETSVITAAA